MSGSRCKRGKTAPPARSIRLTFHLPPEASLQNILWLCDALCRAGNVRCGTRGEMITLTRRLHDVPSRMELADYAHRLGVVTKSSAGWGLPPLTLSIMNCPDPVQRDLLHFLAYTAWSVKAPMLTPFWSYRCLIDTLYTLGEVDLVRNMHDLVEEVLIASRTVFAGVRGYREDRVSFNVRSVRGIRWWLRALQPPVIAGDRFTRRQTCSAQLIVLALGEAARRAGIAPGSDMLLSQDRREDVCRVCLLDPGYLDRMLDWALPQFPALLAPGMRGGSYGRSVRLLQYPSVELVCPVREVVV